MRLYKGDQLITNLQVIGDTTNFVTNNADQTIELVLENNYDYTYKANAVSLSLEIPNTIEHGFICGVNFTCGEVVPTWNVNNYSVYDLTIWKNGVGVDTLILEPNTIIVSAFFCDGINIYWYVKEV